MRYLILFACLGLSACLSDPVTVQTPDSPSSDSMASVLAFSLQPGEYNGTQVVRLVDTSGLEIHFTTDGRAPTLASPQWPGQHVVDSAAYFRIKAWKRNGMDTLPALTGSFLILPKVFGSLIDPRDGKVYRTVRIGDATWMAQNLDYRFQDTLSLDTVGGTEMYSGNLVGSRPPPSLAFDVAVPKSGRAYEQDSLATACMSGWHLPDSSEWSALSQAAGGSSLQLSAQSGWKEDLQGTDRFGFSALPLGMLGAARISLCCIGDESYGKGVIASFWSSTPSAAYVTFHGGDSGMTISASSPNWRMTGGLAVRCVKD